MQTLEQSRVELEGDVSSMRLELAGVNKEKDQAVAGLRDAQARCDRMRDECSRVEENLGRLHTDNVTLDASVAALREERMRMERERETMLGEKSALESSMGELRGVHVKMNAERKALAEENKKMVAEQEALKRALVKLQQEQACAQEQSRVLSHSLNQVHEELKRGEERERGAPTA